MHPSEPLVTLDELRRQGRSVGIDHLGVAPGAVLERARAAIGARIDAGYDADMAFTFRNPDRSTDPDRAVPGARSIIVAARSYAPDADVRRPHGVQARVARYARADHYGPLRDGLRAMARRIRRSGHRAVAFVDDNSMVDREAAWLGGLGWFGKNANLLLPGLGSYFVLGNIVTTADYPPASQPVRDGCGSCRRCLHACPTGAITAPGVIDANRCLAWVLQRPGTIPVELRPAVGDRIYGCDDCQEACPPTVRFTPRHATAPDARDQAWVDVLDLLDADDATLLERHGRWYLAGRDPRWLRRNALVVLGNTTGATTDRTVGRRVRVVLTRYLDGPDRLLAEHARWAADRLGLAESRAAGAPGST